MIRGYIDRENYNAFSTYKKSLVKFNYLCFLRGTKSINEQIVIIYGPKISMVIKCSKFFSLFKGSIKISKRKKTQNLNCTL